MEPVTVTRTCAIALAAVLFVALYALVYAPVHALIADMQAPAELAVEDVQETSSEAIDYEALSYSVDEDYQTMHEDSERYISKLISKHN